MRPSLLVAAAAILLAGRSVLAQSAPSAPPSSTAPAAPPPPNQAAPPPATSPPAASPLPTSYPPQQAYPPPPGYPAQPGYPPSGAPRPPPDAHSHAGFFLRMALGIGYMADSAKIEGGAYAGEVDARGVAVPLELAIGGAISPGFILAGSFTFQGLSRPNLTNDTRLMRPDHRPQLTMLALMADIYPNPKQGFHVGGGLGFASLRVRDDGFANTSSNDENGFGFAPHVGYEWWVSNYWGLGVLGRFIYARTKGDYADGTATESITASSISFSATYN